MCIVLFKENGTGPLPSPENPDFGLLSRDSSLSGSQEEMQMRNAGFTFRKTLDDKLML